MRLQVAKGKEMDFLNEFTKKEIIEWIRQDFHFQINPPKKSSLLFNRWQTRSNELEKKYEKSMEMLSDIDGKTRDELAKRFNIETDLEKRLAILKKIESYDKQFRKWRDFEKAITKEEAEVEKIYQSIDKARKEEQLTTIST
jgi:hypothetical protein